MTQEKQTTKKVTEANLDACAFIELFHSTMFLRLKKTTEKSQRYWS